ncbi:MAG: hypothetical protein MSG64_19805 [Pyrinomonadaceae bacterium MAG19_C2-C3]|nr:hypothetical protein [Pyrinomonadaceae bacterium MAG19_C2-C3]
MKRFVCSLLVVAVSIGMLSASVVAQQPSNATISNATPGTLPAAEIDRIIRAFTAKETAFREALNQYGFKREVDIRDIGAGGQVAGRYVRNSRFVFGDNGEKFEKIDYMPMSTLTNVTLTPEDLEDLGGIQPFALEAAKINLYNLTYVGTEQIDEIDAYVFDAAPKVMPNPKKTKERLFQGRVWVDKQDLQIVKARGKGVPETKTNKFPIFETYREQIDGKYWFPSYVSTNDELVFDNGGVIRISGTVRYKDYKRGTGKLIIVEDDGEAPEASEPSNGGNNTAPKP